MRVVFAWIFLNLFSGVAAFGATPDAPVECVAFAKLPESFTRELSFGPFDPKKAQIRFIPFSLPGKDPTASKKGFVLQQLESCGVSGNCESLVYLPVAKDCYVDVLAFTGRWSGVLGAGEGSKRKPASIGVDDRIFEFDEKNFRFEERE